MKTYFIQFHCNQAKNKAQEELQEFMYTYQNTLCDENGLNRIVDSFKHKAFEIEEKHPRCKPIKLYFNKEGYVLPGIEFYAHTPDYENVFTTSIIEVKREEFSDHSKLTSDNIY
jgi:hypothetical protein